MRPNHTTVPSRPIGTAMASATSVVVLADSAIAGLNMLYRWDWHAWHLEYPNDHPNGSESHELELFWMMPRKGIMARDTITVTPADEPAVRAWLEPHWQYMRDLWEPLASTPTERAS